MQRCSGLLASSIPTWTTKRPRCRADYRTELTVVENLVCVPYGRVKEIKSGEARAAACPRRRGANPARPAAGEIRTRLLRPPHPRVLYLPPNVYNMPRITPHGPEASAHVRHWPTPDPRTDPGLRIEDCPEFVTVEGPASQVTLAAIIQQTYRQARQELPSHQIKFTGFVGVNLLRRYCSKDACLTSAADQALTEIGMRGRMSVSRLPLGARIRIRNIGVDSD